MQVSKVHIVYPGFIQILEGGKKERLTSLGADIGAPTYFKLERTERERLQAYTLLVWGSSFSKILVFQGKDEITLLKQNLSLCTPTELLPSIHFISCSVKYIIHQMYEEKSVAKKKTTIIAFPGSVL